MLIGGGGHCKACIDVIEATKKFNIIGVLDKSERIGETLLGYSIIGSDDMIESLAKQNNSFLITIGQLATNGVRQELFNRLLECNAKIATVVSPRAYVSTHSMIGQGTIIMHDALINADATIGENCIINSKALIEHDVVVGDGCHVSTAAVINGGTSIKSGSFIGSNAVGKEGATLSAAEFVKAGSVFKGDNE